MNFVWKNDWQAKQSQAHAYAACLLPNAYKTPDTDMNDPIAMPFARFLLIIDQFRSK